MILINYFILYEKLVNVVFFQLLFCFMRAKVCISTDSKIYFFKMKERLSICKLPLFGRVYN